MDVSYTLPLLRLFVEQFKLHCLCLALNYPSYILTLGILENLPCDVHQHALDQFR